MSQRDELEFQGGAATKAEAEYGNDGGKDRDHARDVGGGAKISSRSRSFGVLSKHGTFRCSVEGKEKPVPSL
jgi:hypothetical protein